MAVPSPRHHLSNGNLNGFATNGHARSPTASSRFSSSMTFSRQQSRRVVSGASNYKLSFISELTTNLKRQSASGLGAGLSKAACETSFVQLIEWIRSERLSSLPHKGSTWDKVLIRAQYFATKINEFNEAVSVFALDSRAAAEVGYGHAKLLLEFGHENSHALDTVFAFFYKTSLRISALVARSRLLPISSDTREELCLLYGDLLSLITEVAIRLHKIINGMLSSKTSLDLYEVFGDTIETINNRCANVTKEIWAFVLENSEAEGDEAVHVDVLSRWLSPQDRVLASLSRDHTTFSDQQAEFTCMWFLKHLSRFVQGEKDVLMVNGQPGSGKTVLGAWVVDRLQQPIARKQFSTLYCSISSGIPTQATSANLVKSLLHQLLNLRIGDLGIYSAIAKAYNHSRTCTSTTAYEDHLWAALSDSLRIPLENSDPLVIIVDGFDELSGHSQSTFDRLLQTTQHGRSVKLIALSESLKLASNIPAAHVSITPDDISADLHAVTFRALSNYKFFQQQEAFDQEDTLRQITDASHGNFLWAILACDLLEEQKSNDAFLKTLHDIAKISKGAPAYDIQKLTSLLVSALNPKEEARMILGWLLTARRPLTISELSTLFSIDHTRLTMSDTKINVQQVLRDLRPLLVTNEDVVRIRHVRIGQALKHMVESKKLTIQPEHDLLLRILTYQKLSLTESRDPSVNDFDQALVNRLFQGYRLLEYSIRYWSSHMPKDSEGDYELTPDVQKALPDNVLVPLLEWLCLEAELPAYEALLRHVRISTLRSRALTDKSLTVLQMYIIVASYQTLFNHTTEAAKYYYSASKICVDILGYSSLTIEICQRFLSITETWKFTSRTESFIYTETVYTILIEAYTRQYGATAEVVIKLRTTLAEFYVAIKEEEKARKIYVLIQGLADDNVDDDNRAGITIKRPKKSDGTEQGPILLDEQEEVYIEVLDIKVVIELIKRAEYHFTRKEWFQSELIYVELWQQLSSKCRTTRSIEWHQKKIEVALQYSKFLHEQKRTTEATYILTCLWQEYQHHEVAFASEIVTLFAEVARYLKTINQHTLALSIFKYVSTSIKTLKIERNERFSKIDEEIAMTSTEVVKQSLSETTTITESSSSVSQSTFRSVFHSMITNSTKTVDKTTMTLAKKVTATYMSEKKWSEAVTIVNLTLSRVWSSFLKESVHSVTLTSTFREESVELIESLAKCYLELRLLEKIEDVYIRFFQAVLTALKPTDTLFEKARFLLIAFYDKHGFADKSIKVLQELLTVYKKTLGSNHKLVITVLYELGSRCRKHARSHPYWIEYYIQILAILNKDSDICHHDAMEALIIVTKLYWEDRRYAEAVTVYAVLWHTFVSKTKEYKHFSETKFVVDLFERYLQCLEETRVEFEVLHKVAVQYRETCIKSFSATASISIEATITLAEICQRSEQHSSEAISLFEEVSKHSSISSTRITQIKKELRSLYTREITKKSSSSVTKESIQKAIGIYQEQLTEYKSTYGYSHSTTLQTMRQLLVFYQKQEKHELIFQEMHTAVVNILTNETNSTKLIEAASFIAETLSIVHQEEHCKLLIEELHVQIVAYRKHSSKFNFDLTHVGRKAIPFIASLMYQLRSDLQITLTEITANLIYEAFHYDHFKRLIKSNDGLDKIIIAAAPLCQFLTTKNHTILSGHVTAEIVELFVTRDTAKLKLRSPKASPHLFIVAILDHLGQRKQKDFIHSVIHASNDNVLHLTQGSKFNEAYDVAHCAFLFALHHKGYAKAQSVSQGFKLALLLAGRGGAARCPDVDIRKHMLELSNKIIKEILKVCKELNIPLAKLRKIELNELSALLGEQEDYVTLDKLLQTLWASRDVQKNWKSDRIQLGHRLIAARFLTGEHVKAIRLAEDIAYNLRRTLSIRHPSTLETYELLSQLYTTAGHIHQSGTGKHDKPMAHQFFKKALVLQEDLIRTFLYDGTVDDSDDDEMETTAAILSQYGSAKGGNSDDGQFFDAESEHSLNEGQFIREHIHSMKLAYQRFGEFVRSKPETDKFNKDLFVHYADSLKGVEGIEKWSASGFGAGKAESKDGGFEKPVKWDFVVGDGAEKMVVAA